jgi:hypothetical protein
METNSAKDNTQSERNGKAEYQIMAVVFYLVILRALIISKQTSTVMPL